MPRHKVQQVYELRARRPGARRRNRCINEPAPVINLVGYLHAESCTGEAARSTLRVRKMVRPSDVSSNRRDTHRLALAMSSFSIVQ